MKYLYLDIASHHGLIACIENDQLVQSQQVDHRISDTDLVQKVEQVLGAVGWNYQDFTHLACVIGPGGFTSLRIAVAYINTLADQLCIPSTGIHLSDLYLERWSPLDSARDDKKVSNEIYWLHSTKKNELFIRGGQWKEPTLISLDTLPTDVAWMGELIEEHQKLMQKPPLDLRLVEEVLPSLVQKLHYQQQVLLPWYGRGW